MCFHKLFLLLLFVLICDSLFAATFIVTSNADSGPGTLRQALLDAAANGTTVTDYINFNLPGNMQADITIAVQTQLPDVTANVVIDGTTQPGPYLGVSNAKVIITPATATQYLNAFNVSKQVGANDAVEFYGLYIKDFSPNQRGLGDAIVTNANCRLVVGAPGKGNVISGDWYALLGYFQNAKIQSNFIGLAPDGETVEYNADILYSTEAYNDLFDNLLIGGDDLVDGNIIIGGADDGIDLQGMNPTATQTVTVKNNSFGTDYTGTIRLAGTTSSFLVATDPSINLLVYNNVFTGANPDIGILTQGTLVVKGNYFGTDRTQTHPFIGGYEAIDVVTGVVATIGGDAPADQNVFTNYYNPIFANNDANMLIIKNTFYCNNYVSVGNLISNSYINITNLTNTTVSGDAAPGALIQLYYADAVGCPNCNPTTWFANVTANANGNWAYTGNTAGSILASSTVNNNTFGFQRFIIYPGDVTLANYDCHHPGSIKVNKNRTGRLQFTWKDNATGKAVGSGQEIDNLPPGVYNLEINEGVTCPLLAEGQFTILDLTPHVYPETFQLDCSNPTGYFTAYPQTGPGITVTNYYWEDDKGNPLSSTADVKNLPSGNYYLYITDSNGCTSTKALCQVLPPINAPVVDDSKVAVTDANCDFADGAITGLTISNAGNANFGWSRADGTGVSNGQTDLKNVPAGQYYFFAEYDFNCPPVKSRTFTVIGKNAITIDDSGIAKTPSTCNNSNGSIDGIVTTGATAYQWFDDKNKMVYASLDLKNVAAGNYYLVASNSSCTKQTAVYTIPNTPAVNNYQSSVVTNDASCNLNNAGIAVTFSSVPAPASYRWVSPEGAPLATNAPLTNVPPGAYQLYVTDLNGCESFYKTYTLNNTPQLQIVQGSAQITNDQCAQSVASIDNAMVSGGVPPYTYSWLNSLKQVISNSMNLVGVGKGIYTLQVKDATNCGLASQDYTVANESTVIPPPDVANLQICSPGAALLLVKNPQAGYGYRLYATATGTVIMDDEPTGAFKITVANSGSLYVSQYTGDCESPRTEVLITIGLSSINIPNTFTPNGDGVNDLWTIKGIENYPSALVQLFNRYGQKVFESKGYARPFDGKMGGLLLPTGVYYYIINLNSNCRLLSGSLAILR